jgi:N utilization substance protein A
MKKGAKAKPSKAIDSKEMLLAMEDLEKENGMEPGSLMEAIETALITAYKRDFDSTADNAKVVVDKETGDYHVFVEKEVVEEVEDGNVQISLEDAKKINKSLEVGDTAQIEIMPKNFGRIAAGTAKQVIIQKIREASREFLYNEFSDRKGEIVSGLIQKADGGIVVVDLGRLEGVMPLKEQVPTEKYHVNDKIRAYVLDVEKGAKGAPQVIISRAHADFVRKLFELEIPEIYEGVIEIKSVSRDAGSRSKVAVYSPNENIDPVGSCVGQKGIRIQNIINELGGEKIDVIEWSEDPAVFISAALLPAQVLAVDVKEEEKFAQVIVPDDQLSLAIGKSGQNARLAAKLTNWKIDIKSESQFRQILAEAQNAENAEDIENETNNEVEETAETTEE